MEQLILISNPGSSSRKYGIYRGTECLMRVHFEHVEGKIIYTVFKDDAAEEVTTDLQQMDDAITLLDEITSKKLGSDQKFSAIGVRVVAPSSDFLIDVVLDEACIKRLKELEPSAPLHIRGTIEEVEALSKHFPEAKIFGISDSRFHAGKPAKAWNYAIPIHDADRFNIKRFGYHGLSVASVVEQLKNSDQLTPKTIVCHLGSGVSITALQDGKSVDNTMGFSPLDGVAMATRSGSLDIVAYHQLKRMLQFDDEQMYHYLNKDSGLKGLSGVSPDIRELLKQEDNPLVELALETYVYNIQKAIGQMASSLNGVELLVFTGTVGERSFPMRQRIVASLSYLGFEIDEAANDQASEGPVQKDSSKPILVVPAQEEAEMARRVKFMV